MIRRKMFNLTIQEGGCCSVSAESDPLPIVKLNISWQFAWLCRIFTPIFFSTIFGSVDTETLLQLEVKVFSVRVLVLLHSLVHQTSIPFSQIVDISYDAINNRFELSINSGIWTFRSTSSKWDWTGVDMDHPIAKCLQSLFILFPDWIVAFITCGVDSWSTMAISIAPS